MKPIKTSFLFFVLIICALLLPSDASSQSKNDSISYYYNLVYNTKESTDLLKANSFYNSLKEKSITQGDTLRAINSLRIIASIQFKLNSFYESEFSAVEAIRLLDHLEEKEKTKKIKIGLNNHLGLNYSALYDYKKAVEYYEKNIRLGLDSSELITTINNKALALEAIDETKLALFEFEKAYEQSLLLEDKLIQARALDNLGFIKSKLNIPEGLKNMELALKLRQNVDYKPGIYTSYNHLARYYHQIGNLQQARNYSDKAIVIAREINSPKYLENALSTSLKIKNIDLATEYINIKDSLIKASQIAENKNASSKYNYDKHEKIAQKSELKFQQSELEKEKQKSKTILWFTIASIITISSIFLFFLLKSKHKKEKLEQVYTIESEISKKVHDEVANDVFQVMTKLQSQTEISNNLKNDIEQIYEKARDISKQLGELDVEGDYKTILNDLVISYNNSDTNVIVKDISKIQWEKISKNKMTALYKVLQELLINMKKHSKASVAVITFLNTQKKILISYNDDGIGCELKKSTGLQNVENRIKSINGTITFESKVGKGFKAIIEV